MHAPSEPESPVSLIAKRMGRPGDRPRLVTAVVVGSAGTVCSASTPSFADATLCVQESFWRVTAEGAYQ